MNWYRISLAALFLFSGLGSVVADDRGEVGPACMTPSDRVESHMMSFARRSEDWSNARARAAVGSTEPVALTDQAARGICEKLWEKAAPLLAVQKQTESGEFYKFDVGFYSFGPFYAVAALENTVDPAREEIPPLERIHTGAEGVIVLFSRELEFLGHYDYRGYSRDRDPELVLNR